MSMLRTVWRGPREVNAKVTNRTDYNQDMPPAPAPTGIIDGAVWGDGEWGAAEWGAAGYEKRVYQQWKNAYGGGEVHSPLVQVGSGSNAPLDGELIRIDALFTTGDVVV